MKAKVDVLHRDPSAKDAIENEFDHLVMLLFKQKHPVNNVDSN